MQNPLICSLLVCPGNFVFCYFDSGENLERVSLVGKTKHCFRRDPFKSLLSRQGFDRLWLNYFKKHLIEQLMRDFLIYVERYSWKCWFFYFRVVKSKPRLTPWAWRCPQIFSLLQFWWVTGCHPMAQRMVPEIDLCPTSGIKTLNYFLDDSTATLLCKIAGIFWPNWLLTCWGCLWSGVLCDWVPVIYVTGRTGWNTGIGCVLLLFFCCLLISGRQGLWRFAMKCALNRHVRFSEACIWSWW